MFESGTIVQPSRYRRAIMGAIAVFLSLTICLLLVELTLRVLDPNGASYAVFSAHYEPKLFQADNYQHHLFKPDVNVFYKSKEFAAPVRTNSLGMRDYDIADLLNENNKRILFLGDSFIAGLHVAIEDTVSKRLEGLLNADPPQRFTVINGAVSSYSPVLEYLQLKRLAPILRPSIVILGLWINDFGGDYELLSSSEAHFDHDGIVDSVKGMEQPPPGLLYRHFYLYHFLQERAYVKDLLARLIPRFALRAILGSHALENQSDPKDGEDYLQRSIRDEKVLSPTLSYVRAIKRYCDANKMTFVIVIIPEPNQVGTEQVRPGWHCVWYSPAEFIESTRYQDTLTNFCVKENIPVIDLLPSFRSADHHGWRMHFRFNGHWNEKGHHLAAQAIYEYLARNSSLLQPSDEQL